jgi:D-alanyl-D-alanine carboxypeptidase
MQIIKNTFSFLVMLALAISCSHSEKNSNTSVSEINTDIFQAIIDSIYNSNPESLGLMVHIESPNNGISWSGIAGYADIEKSVLDKDQPMLIASNTKTYISAAILRLQEDKLLSIEDNLAKHLPQKTIDLFQADGYDFNSIKIKHLLSHTSGIADYVNDDYFEFIDKNQKYRWTRDEQLELATTVGDPIGEAQEIFSYADVNYLLATEIIEQKTGKPFYTAIRELLKYDALNLANTWFPTLEETPVSTKDFVHQYWNETDWGNRKMNISWDSYLHDISWDLYGGGGVATTISQLGQFYYHLFNGDIIENDSVLDLIKTDVVTRDNKSKNYRLGVSNANIKGLSAFGHGGFWGTNVFYFPELDASMAVCVLERRNKMNTIKSTINNLIVEVNNQLNPIEHIITEDYELYKRDGAETTLVLFPGGGSSAEDTKREFDILTAAKAQGISVLFMNFQGGLWLDEDVTQDLADKLDNIFEKNGLRSESVFIGGMSLGGNTALTLSNYLTEHERSFAPEGVFIVDSPVDLHALYLSSIKDLSNPDFDEERLAEPKFIANYFEKEFSRDSLMENIQEFSPFTVGNGHVNVAGLEDCKLRFYIEPDILWWKENRMTDFESTNAYAIQQIVKDLKSKKWENVELIETENKGYRANGDRNPHSWSIVDIRNLIEWMNN